MSTTGALAGPGDEKTRWFARRAARMAFRPELDERANALKFSISRDYKIYQYDIRFDITVGMTIAVLAPRRFGVGRIPENEPTQMTKKQ